MLFLKWKKYPNIFRYVYKENGGHGSTINKGIELAQGKYFRVLDGDDYFSISENEYNTMINSHTYGNVNYYVCRVFVDINNPNFEYHFLKFENNTLKSINGDLEYVFDKQENDNYYFKRNQKVKVLQ